MPVARLAHSSLAPIQARPSSPLPRLEAGFRAVEEAIRRLGIDAPHALRSPLPVEEALFGSTILQRSLLILDPAELRSAEIDLEETVADERAGGALFVSLPNPSELLARRSRYRDLAASTAAYAFVDDDLPHGFGRFKAVERPRSLRRYRLVVADTPGFRVAVCSREIESVESPGGGSGFVGLWTGDDELVAEASECLRHVARAEG